MSLITKACRPNKEGACHTSKQTPVSKKNKVHPLTPPQNSRNWSKICTKKCTSSPIASHTKSQKFKTYNAQVSTFKVHTTNNQGAINEQSKHEQSKCKQRTIKAQATNNQSASNEQSKLSQSTKKAQASETQRKLTQMSGHLNNLNVANLLTYN